MPEVNQHSHRAAIFIVKMKGNAVDTVGDDDFLKRRAQNAGFRLAGPTAHDCVHLFFANRREPLVHKFKQFSVALLNAGSKLMGINRVVCFVDDFKPVMLGQIRHGDGGFHHESLYFPLDGGHDQFFIAGILHDDCFGLVFPHIFDAEVRSDQTHLAPCKLVYSHEWSDGCMIEKMSAHIIKRLAEI